MGVDWRRMPIRGIVSLLDLHYQRWESDKSDSEFDQFVPAFVSGETQVSPFAGISDDE